MLPTLTDFAEIVTACDALSVPGDAVDTNLVFIDVSRSGHTAAELSAALEEQGINVGVMGDTTLRAVTHLDVDRNRVEEAAHALVRSVSG